jgi:hypothetical protein
MDHGVTFARAPARPFSASAPGSRRRLGTLLRLLAWFAPLLALGPLVAISTSPPALIRGPYLQLVTRTSVTVLWHTDDAGVCGLEIRPAGGREPTRIVGDTSAVCSGAPTLARFRLRPTRRTQTTC